MDIDNSNSIDLRTACESVMQGHIHHRVHHRVHIGVTIKQFLQGLQHAMWVMAIALPLAGCGGDGDSSDMPATADASASSSSSESSSASSSESSSSSSSSSASSSSSSSSSSAVPPPLSATVISLDDGHQVGDTHWADGDTSSGGLGQTVAGLSCGTPDETYHVHTHVSIFLNGQALAVPANVGIVELTSTSHCYYALHTHNRTGIVHIEGPAPATFTLGQFFEIWGQPLGPTDVAGNPGLPVVVYVTDNGVVTQYSGDLTAIELISHREITIQIGTAITEIPNYTWTGT